MKRALKIVAFILASLTIMSFFSQATIRLALDQDKVKGLVAESPEVQAITGKVSSVEIPFLNRYTREPDPASGGTVNRDGMGVVVTGETGKHTLFVTLCVNTQTKAATLCAVTEE